MGARIILCDPHRAVVIGPAQLHGERMESPDIRAGMAMLIAALCAEGEPDRQHRPDRPRLRADRRAAARARRADRADRGVSAERLADLAADGAVTLHEPLNLFRRRAGGQPPARAHAGAGPQQRRRGLRRLPAAVRPGRDRGGRPHALERPCGVEGRMGGRGRRMAVLRRDRLGRPVRLRGRRRRRTVSASSVQHGARAGRLRVRRVAAPRLPPACVRPRDDLTVAVRERLGRLPVSEHVAFHPAAAGAELEPAAVVRMPAVAAMRAAATRRSRSER